MPKKTDSTHVIYRKNAGLHGMEIPELHLLTLQNYATKTLSVIRIIITQETIANTNQQIRATANADVRLG